MITPPFRAGRCCYNKEFEFEYCCPLQGVDLRQYSKQVEGELLEVENASIQDCILGPVVNINKNAL